MEIITQIEALQVHVLDNSHRHHSDDWKRALFLAYKNTIRKIFITAADGNLMKL